MPAGSDILNQSYIDNASTAFLVRYQEIFERGVPGLWNEFTDKLPTDSETTEFDFLGAMPVVRKWVGQKRYPPQRAYKQAATLESYESTFSIPRKKARYDRTGLIGRRINACMTQAQGWYDKLGTDALVSNPTGYDGVPLFSGSHPHGPSGATQSNTTASAFSFATVKTARQAGQELRDEKGEPFMGGVVYDTFMWGPKNEATGLEVIEAEIKPDAVTAANAHLDVGDAGTPVAAVGRYNVWQGKYRGITNPRLTGVADDYVFAWDSSKTSISNIIVCLEGRAPEPVKQDRMEDHPRFHNDLLLYSLEADLVFVAGLWQLGYAWIL